MHEWKINAFICDRVPAEGCRRLFKLWRPPAVHAAPFSTHLVHLLGVVLIFLPSNSWKVDGESAPESGLILDFWGGGAKAFLTAAATVCAASNRSLPFKRSRPFSPSVFAYTAMRGSVSPTSLSPSVPFSFCSELSALRSSSRAVTVYKCGKEKASLSLLKNSLPPPQFLPQGCNTELIRAGKNPIVAQGYLRKLLCPCS